MPDGVSKNEQHVLDMLHHAPPHWAEAGATANQLDGLPGIDPLPRGQTKRALGGLERKGYVEHLGLGVYRLVSK